MGVERSVLVAVSVRQPTVMDIVYRSITTHLIKKAGFTNKTAHTGAVTLPVGLLLLDIQAMRTVGLTSRCDPVQ